MKTRYFAALGRDVSRIALGTTPIGSAFDEAKSFALLDEYANLGGNFIDLARVYGHGAAEKTVGKWLKSAGKAMVISTKGGHPDENGRSRLDAESLRDDLCRSLDALGTDHVDLYFLHRDDPARDAGEMVETLQGFRREGLIAAFGASNWRRARLEEAGTFFANQPQWSLARMEVFEDPTLVQMDRDLYEYHVQTNLPCLCFTSQAKGFFAKLYEGGEDALSDKARRRYLSPHNRALYEEVLRARAETGLSVSAISLLYLISQPFPTYPICGVSSVMQARVLGEAGEAELPRSIADRLTRAAGLIV